VDRTDRRRVGVEEAVDRDGGEDIEWLDLIRITGRQGVVIGVLLTAEAEHPVGWIVNNRTAWQANRHWRCHAFLLLSSVQMVALGD
jgi:hypothetical protein